MFADGQRVQYAGDPIDGLDIGDVGVIAQAGHTASFVKWATGARKGTFTEVPHHEIQPVGVNQDTDAFTGTLVTFAVRQAHAQVGPRGLLDILNEQGHLSSFTAIGEEAMALVASRIRQDPSIREVLSQLEGEDGDDFVEVATVALLRDAFGQGSGS